MLEVITKWNLTRPDEVITDFVAQITLRGYSVDAQLPGEFLLPLTEDKIKPLSVGYIADRICPTRRDLYFQKGLSKVKAKDSKTWGREAGRFVENYFYGLRQTSLTHVKPLEALEDFIHRTSQYNLSVQGRNYSKLHVAGEKFTSTYFDEKEESIETLKSLELVSGKSGDTTWLLKILTCGGRADLASRLLHSILRENNSASAADLEIQRDVAPNINTGINAPTQPDFIISRFKVVGDIKTGDRFKDMYQLTCAGYALAYENETGKDINWGSIYFIPTRNSSRYAQVINYPQLHIFPINQELRQWFLDNRDEAYSIISKAAPPNFPTEKDQCPYCKYYKHCTDDGLQK